ncbi:MAG: hypothetical protein GYB64_20695 [Chloroflexi bacterium]|nr:hypothetical protein [Chloroflexota bacterium]
MSRLWLALVIGAAMCGFSAQPAHMQDDLFVEETFDDGEAQGWSLDGAWFVDDGLLSGEGSGYAEYTGVLWRDHVTTVALVELSGILQLHAMADGEQRYILEIIREGDFLILVVNRVFADGSQSDVLASAEAEIAAYNDSFGSEPLFIDFAIEANTVSVRLEGETLIEFFDEFAFDEGRVAINLIDSFALIDALFIEGTGQRPDLTLLAVELVDVYLGSVIVEFEVIVANGGPGEAPPTEVCINPEVSPEAGTCAEVPPLAPQEDVALFVTLELDDDWQGQDAAFVAVLDPGGEIPERDEENNLLVTDVIALPGGGTQVEPPAGVVPPPATGPNLLPVLVLFLGGLLGLALVIRVGRRIRRRGQQREAQRGEPTHDCTPGERYTQVETEVGLRRMKVRHITLRAADANRSVRTLRGALPRTLHRAIRERRTGSDPAETVEAFASGLAAEALDTLLKHDTAQELTVEAHLEGLEVENTYTPYRCVKQGGTTVWKKGIAWTVSQQQARDDALVVLSALDPNTTSKASLLAPIRGAVTAYLEHRFGPDEA